MGNDLQFTVGFDPSVANYTTSIVYDTEPVKIGWILNKSTGVFSNIYFNGNYAIAKDSNYLIIIFECRFEDINAIEYTDANSRFTFCLTSIRRSTVIGSALVQGFSSPWSGRETTAAGITGSEGTSPRF